MGFGREARQLTSKPRRERIHIFLVEIAEIDLSLHGGSVIASPLAVGFAMNAAHFHERGNGTQWWLDYAGEWDRGVFNVRPTEDEECPLVGVLGLQLLDGEAIKDSLGAATSDGEVVSDLCSHS